MTTDQFFSALRRQASIASSEWPDRRITDALPTPNRESGEVHDSAVSGEVIAVERGAAYVNPSDAHRAVEVDFNSPEAQWKVFRVTVDSDWGLEVDTPTAEFGLVTSAETAEADVRSGLIGADVIVFLEEPGWFQFDAKLPNIGHSGELLGRVGSRGKISFPVMEAGRSDAYLGDVSTLDELRRSVAHID